VREDYYWNIAPDKDATVGMMVMTEEAPLMVTQYRQRWDRLRLS
jgi:lipopolysaccharide assembly outer membrane protein LptD (OstA)